MELVEATGWTVPGQVLRGTGMVQKRRISAGNLQSRLNPCSVGRKREVSERTKGGKEDRRSGVKVQTKEGLGEGIHRALHNKRRGR